MKNFRRDVRIAVLILVAAFAVSQFFRIEKSNPPERLDASLDPTVKPLLKRACYNCHSHETVWPWYSNIAPVSWLLASDVKGGRRNLNFSKWETYPADVQDDKKKEVVEMVKGKDMPPWYYSIVHGDSRLTSEERSQIVDWASGLSGH